MRSHTLLWPIVAGLVGIVPAAAQTLDAERVAGTAMMVAVYVDACIRTDQTLRDICERHRPHLPESFKGRCTLPAQSFEQRTAVPYTQFRDAYRAAAASAGQAGEGRTPESSLAARTSPGAGADLRLDQLRARWQALQAV